MGPDRRAQYTAPPSLSIAARAQGDEPNRVVHEVFACPNAILVDNVLDSQRDAPTVYSGGAGPTRPPLPMSPLRSGFEAPVDDAPCMSEHMDKTPFDLPELVIVSSIVRSDKHEAHEPHGGHGHVSFLESDEKPSILAHPSPQAVLDPRLPTLKRRVSFHVNHPGDGAAASLGLPGRISSKRSTSSRYGSDRSPSRRAERSLDTPSEGGHSHSIHSRESHFAFASAMSTHSKPTASMHVASLRSSFNRARTKELGLNLEDCEEVDLSSLRMEWQRWLARVIISTPFEALIIGCIAVNTLVIIFEDQFAGFERGYNMNYPTVSKQAGAVWHDYRDVFIVLEWLFGVIFTVELLLKLLSFEYRVFADAWGWIDTIIVLGFIVERVHSLDMQTSATLLRSVKMVRLLRVLKLTHSLQAFDNFYLMTAALRESMWASFYAFLLLLMMQVIVALLIESALVGYLTDTSKPLASRQLVFEYYGTFTRALLTIFEVTLANWPEPVRILSEDVSEWWSIVFLAYVLCVGFAVVRVIMSVFTSVTFFVYEFDDKLMVARHKRATNLHLQKMTELFKAADGDGNGLLDLEEFRHIFADSHVSKWLGAMEFGYSLRGSGADALFNLLDDGDEALRAHELIDGVAQLKGPAKAVGLAVVMRELKEVEMLVDRIAKELKRPGLGCGISSRSTVSSKRSKASRKSEQENGGDGSSDSESSGESIPHLSSTNRTGSQRRFSVENWKTAKQLSAESIGSVAGRLFVGDTLSSTSIESKLTKMTSGARSSAVTFRQAFKAVMQSAKMESFFIAMLALYAVLCMVDAQYQGMQVGYEIGHEGHDSPAGEEWPGVREALDPCLIAMGSLFLLELVGRLLAHGVAMFRNTWNIVDIVANASWLLELTPWMAERDSIPLQLSLLRFVRVTRLSRLLVLVHLSSRFSKLQLMWTAIRGSLSALGWTIVMLAFSLVFVALTLGTLLEEDYGGDADVEERWRLYLYFGSFSKSMLTMFELTLANWVLPCRALVETSSEWYTLYCLGHKVSFGFCIVTVIAAVFLQETFTIAKNDNAVQHNMRTAAAREHTKKMVKLFKAADADGNGAVDFDEFKGVMCKTLMQSSTPWMMGTRR